MRVAEMNKDAANPLWLCYARCSAQLSFALTSTAPPLVPLRIPRASILACFTDCRNTNVKLINNLDGINRSYITPNTHRVYT
jgi:hypothetical protein